MNASLADVVGNHPHHNIVAGVDWGKQNDFTAISIGCGDCKVELWHDRFNKIDYAFQIKRLQVGYVAWRVRGVLPERNAMGEPIIERMIRDGVNVLQGPDNKMGFMTTSGTKPQLIENLAVAFDRTEWQFQDDKLWTGEIEAYERTMSKITGRSQYSAPEGLHDDTVIARALMLWAAKSFAALSKQPEQTSRFTTEQDGSRWKGI